MRTPGSIRILEAHLLRYRRTWRGSAITTFVSPLFFLGSIGVGLGSFVDAGDSALAGVGYLAFLAPGLLASSAMQTAAFESTYPVMGGLRWDRTYQAAVSAPLLPRHIAIGNLAFVAVRLLIAAIVFSAIAVALGATDPVRGALMVPAAVLTGLAFAAPIQAFSATQRGDAGFTILFRFVITPLALFSGTFFPIAELPAILQLVAWLTPLAHGVALTRAIALGTPDPAMALHLAVLLAYLVAGAVAAAILFRRRLIA